MGKPNNNGENTNPQELCKKLKFGQMNKGYMHNPASVLENEMLRILWNFEIQTDYFITARRPELIIINKKREQAKSWKILYLRTTE